MAPYRTVTGIEKAAEVTLAADEVSEERWQQEIDRIHNFDTQWPFTQDRDWNQKSGLVTVVFAKSGTSAFSWCSLHGWGNVGRRGGGRGGIGKKQCE